MAKPEEKVLVVPEPELSESEKEAKQLGPTIEEHRADASTPAWAFAAAKAYHRWGSGQRMSRETYDKKVKLANS